MGEQDVPEGAAAAAVCQPEAEVAPQDESEELQELGTEDAAGFPREQPGSPGAPKAEGSALLAQGPARAGEVRVARRRIRKVAAASAVAGAVAGCVCALRASAATPCVVQDDGLSPVDAVVDLAQQYPKDLVTLMDDSQDDRGSLSEWLEAASDAAKAEQAATVKLPAGEAELAVQRAMATTDPKEAERLVRRAARRAVARSQAKRSKIRDLAVGARRSLRRHKRLTESEKAVRATCVIRSFAAADTVAQVAADINDATKTCDGFDIKVAWEKNNTHNKLCVINAGSAVAGLLTLVATLSSLADSCAATLIPNMDALCSASVSGMIVGLAQVAGSALIASNACMPGKGVFGAAPAGVVPSNLGRINSTGSWRRLAEKAEPQDAEAALAAGPVGEGASGAAPPRQLIFGGGKQSTETHCFIDVTQAAWSLAQAGISLSSTSGRTSLLGGCPPRNMFGGTKFKGPMYHYSQEYCAADVASVLTFFAATVAYVNLAVVQCSDVLNLRAICGAGIDGIAGSLSAVAQTALGVNIACKEFQTKGMKKALKIGGTLDYATGGAITSLLGRRLQSADSAVEDLRSKYSSPAEAWKSIGVDFEDPKAEFRKRDPRDVQPSHEDLVELVQERTSPAIAEALASQGKCI